MDDHIRARLTVWFRGVQEDETLHMYVDNRAWQLWTGDIAASSDGGFVQLPEMDVCAWENSADKIQQETNALCQELLLASCGKRLRPIHSAPTPGTAIAKKINDDGPHTLWVAFNPVDRPIAAVIRTIHTSEIDFESDDELERFSYRYGTQQQIDFTLYAKRLETPSEQARLVRYIQARCTPLEILELFNAV